LLEFAGVGASAQTYVSCHSGSFHGGQCLSTWQRLDNQFEPEVEVVDAGTVEVGELVAGLGEVMVAATGGEMVVLVEVGADLPATLRSLMISTILSMVCR